MTFVTARQPTYRAPSNHSNTLQNPTANTVVAIVINNPGPIISDGLADPNCKRYATTLIVTNCKLDILITMNIRILGVAVSGVGLFFCIISIAFNPLGVAAHPNPNILAIKLVAIGSCAG